MNDEVNYSGDGRFADFVYLRDIGTQSVSRLIGLCRTIPHDVLLQHNERKRWETRIRLASYDGWHELSTERKDFKLTFKQRQTCEHLQKVSTHFVYRNREITYCPTNERTPSVP